MEVEAPLSKRISPRRRKMNYEPNQEAKLKVMRTSEGFSDMFQTTFVDFEYGPAELNLYDYIAEEARFLWANAKAYFILKPESEPQKGILLLHTQEENIRELCREHFEFDLNSTTFSKVQLRLENQEDYACVFYLGKQFWNLMQPANAQQLEKVIRNVKRSHIFFITDSEIQKEHAINICRENKICPLKQILSSKSDKSPIYKRMYEILENQITNLLSDLHSRASTRSLRHLPLELPLEELCRKLQSRKKKPTRSLTKQCITLIKDAYDVGCMGYRLCGNDLYIFEDKTSAVSPKRLQIKKSIEKAFNGTVVFKPLHDVISPQCAIKLGGYIGKETGESGTIGIFGKLSSSEASRVIKENIVAISSGHVIGAGADAFVPGKGRVGKCIWPASSSDSMFDISVIEIDPLLISSLQKIILDEYITVENIPEEKIENRRVFKIGATTGRTEGTVNIGNFELFGEKVMAIKPKRSRCPENKFSDEGDSGAIVLTRDKEKLYAVGVIYGDCFNLRESNSHHGDESIAVFLVNALSRFSSAKQQEIVLDKI